MKHLIHTLFGKIHKHSWFTFFLLAILATIFEILGFMQDTDNFEFVMITKALIQSFTDLPTDEIFFLIFGKLLWILVFMSAAVSLFFKEWDIYSFMYLPNYLGEAGYILEESTYQ